MGDLGPRVRQSASIGPGQGMGTGRAVGGLFIEHEDQLQGIAPMAQGKVVGTPDRPYER